jgi:hypothetical protein
VKSALLDILTYPEAETAETSVVQGRGSRRPNADAAFQATVWASVHKILIRAFGSDPSLASADIISVSARLPAHPEDGAETRVRQPMFPAGIARTCTKVDFL